MDNFIISTQQINAILNILGEFPAKQVIAGVDLLRNLPKQVTPAEVTTSVE